MGEVAYLFVQMVGVSGGPPVCAAGGCVRWPTCLCRWWGSEVAYLLVQMMGTRGGLPVCAGGGYQRGLPLCG